MNIQMTGIDHNQAALDVREKFSFTSTENTAFMAKIMEMEELDGCILLNTCNRTELWVSYRENGEQDLLPLICDFKDLNPEKYRSNFYTYKGYEAVKYLFEMTSGLRSMIIGEDQILAQVKKALANAREVGVTGSVLDVLFRSAVTGAKKVKTELTISTANASAVDYAIDRLDSMGVKFTGKKCLVIGNGEMGKRASSALISRGAEVSVTIRQYKSGVVEVVPGCARINYSERFQLIPECDIVVSATSSPNTTITSKDMMECGIKDSIILIDLAVPRDIEPEVANVPGVTLYNIDNFSVLETDELKNELKLAKQLLKEQEEKFINWYECRDLLPAMDRLGVYFGNEVTGRIGSTVKSLGLNHEQKDDLTSAIQNSSEKVLKKLIFAVRDEAGIDVFRKCVEAMEEAENGV